MTGPANFWIVGLIDHTDNKNFLVNRNNRQVNILSWVPSFGIFVECKLYKGGHPFYPAVVINLGMLHNVVNHSTILF